MAWNLLHPTTTAVVQLATSPLSNGIQSSEFSSFFPNTPSSLSCSGSQDSGESDDDTCSSSDSQVTEKTLSSSSDSFDSLTSADFNSCYKVEHLRDVFVKYVKSMGMGHGIESEMLFLDYFYSLSRPYAKKRIENLKDVTVLLEEYCRNLVFDNLDSFLVDVETIEESKKSGGQYVYLRFLSEQSELSCLKHEKLTSLFSKHALLLIDLIESQKDDQQVFETEFQRIGWICDMIYLKIEDLFYLFQSKKSHRTFMSNWLKQGMEQNIIPKYVLELYKTKLENDEKARHQFKFSSDDFNANAIIEKDWNFSKYFSRNMSLDWSVKFLDLPKVMLWSTSTEFSTDDKDLRSSKVISYLDQSLEDIVKAFNHDHTIGFMYDNVKFHAYTPINPSNSTQKYPSAIMTCQMDLGVLAKKRHLQVIISSKTKFVNGEISEFAVFFKSCEFTEHHGKGFKVTVLGTKVYTKLDNNRTRYIQVRMGNLGGLWNNSLLIHNKVTFKKIAEEEYKVQMKIIKEGKKENFQLASMDNVLMKIWTDYCKHYCNVDVLNVYK